MNTILAYWYLKLQALILLVFSKQQAALEKFDQMLVLPQQYVRHAVPADLTY